MKHKLKILTATAALAMAAPMLTAITSCGNKDYNSKAEFFQNETVKEFKALCPVYRPTFHTRKICDYLKQRIKDFGLDQTMIEDDYRAKDEEGKKLADSSGNLTFEISATRGHENDPKIILQDHMDMICKSRDKDYKWDELGVIPVQEGDTIHSKDYMTSLGSDNGIGLAFLLALANNRDSFTHGPIRFIITADEEDGESGAKSVPKEWLDAPYLLNLDGEDPTELTTSCAGAQDAEFSLNTLESIETPTKETYEGEGELDVHQYKIEISGLQGGHSGTKIGENRINAIVLMADMLLFIENRPSGHNVYLTSAESEGGTSNIPNAITFTFATCTPPADPSAIPGERDGTIEGDIYDYFLPYQEFLHPIETDLISKVKLTELKDSSKIDKSLKLDDTIRVLKFITLLPYGPMYYNPTTGDIETSANIGGLVGAKQTGTAEEKLQSFFCLERFPDSAEFRLNFALQGRSSILEHLGTEPSTSTEYSGFYLYYTNLANHIFGSADSISNKSWIPPWPYKQSKLWNTLMEAGKAEGQTSLTPRGVLAWAEVAYFAHKKSDLQIGCIGCRIENEHEPTETTYISSIKTLAYNVLYTLDNLPKV